MGWLLNSWRVYERRKEEMKSLSQRIVESKGKCWHIRGRTGKDGHDYYCKKCGFHMEILNKNYNPDYEHISDAFPIFIELPYSSKTTLLYAWANENAEHEMEIEEYCKQILEEYLSWKEK